MASTFSTHMNLELMKKGEQANAWGTITNDNLSAIDAEFALKSQDSPDGTALTRNSIFKGQQVYATSEKTLYICSSATTTGSTGFHLIQRIKGIDTTGVSGVAVVIDVTGGSGGAVGHVSVSGGINLTGNATVAGSIVCAKTVRAAAFVTA